MTTEHEASRTLVKSPPELWAECSVAESLARHLSGSFGEIRITRLDPETAIAWEGERASGTVRIEPSGWGTRVTLTAQTTVDPAPSEPHQEEAEADDERSDDQDEHEPHGQPEADVQAQDPDSEEQPDVMAQEDPLVAVEVAAEPPDEQRQRRGKRLIARMRAFFKPALAATPEQAMEEQALEPQALELEAAPDAAPEEAPPEAVVEVAPPKPDPAEASAHDVLVIDAAAVLTSALDSLGQAHHRPFSRA